jgi:hypothetical protein
MILGVYPYVSPEEELEVANKKIEKLEKELAGEKEANQDLLPSQLSFYRTQYPKEFAELEKELGKENVRVNN